MEVLKEVSDLGIVGKFGGKWNGNTLVWFDDVAVGYLDKCSFCGWRDVQAVLFSTLITVMRSSHKIE